MGAVAVAADVLGYGTDERPAIAGQARDCAGRSLLVPHAAAVDTGCFHLFHRGKLGIQRCEDHGSATVAFVAAAACAAVACAACAASAAVAAVAADPEHCSRGNAAGIGSGYLDSIVAASFPPDDSTREALSH